jgi:PKD repeat protein
VGYGTGQGLSGYGLGDAVVNREHLGALNPVDGHALEWNPGSNSYEGNKAMEITPRGLFTGGDATTQAGSNIGRIAFFDFNSVPASNGIQTAITEPIEGHVNPAAQQFTVKGTASVTTGTINRVELRVYDRGANRYLADNLTTWQTASNTINTTLQSTGARTANWSLPLTVTGNRKLQLRAQTFSSAGTGDNTPALKKTETFGLTDQPPNTNVSGPTANPVRTKTFTVTGSATDDVGVQSIGMTIRDENNRYLQADGTVSAGGYTFRFAPDVVGATSTTWSKEITVPVEGTWKAQARAVDTAGQSDLDTADRSWIVTEDGQPPTVSISAPVSMVPPTTVQPYVVAPGSPLTFSGSAIDDQHLNNVEITLRNNTTRENLASDGSYGPNAIQDWYRISPLNLTASSYNWSWTTPFNLKPGNYSFQVRATDDLGLTTSSANRGTLTVNAQVPGDAPPDAKLNVTGTITGGQSLHLDLAGTATDDKGVKAVQVALYDNDTSKYLQPNGSLGAAFATRNATLATPNGLSTNWTLPVDLPQGGDWNVTAFGYDTADQQDTSTSGATARYRIYPGDLPPTLTENLLAPSENTTFTDGRIFVSGRAEDDQSMQRVEVAIIDNLGRYMSSSGTFTSTNASWRTAFLTSPGTPGSNFSYTTPVVPPGAYTINIRGIDQHDQATNPVAVRHVNVTHPPGNTAPVAKFTYTCPPASQPSATTNVCEFDGRTSTDENAATLTYAWSFTLTSTSTTSGPKPIRTFTAPGTYTVQLIVTDEWGIASAPVTQQVTITEPSGNVAPVPVINPPACQGLVCNFSGVGSADPNTGDSFGYSWNFGDNTALSTSTSPSHTFAAGGTYTVVLTTTDGWGKAATKSYTVTVP